MPGFPQALALLLALSMPLLALAAEEKRPHDSLNDFVVDPANTSKFEALAEPAPRTDRWSGTLGGAGYRIEVPANWNGKLVVYAHGYVGESKALRVQNAPMRRFMIEQGYAWAASSYSKNLYDVRAGVEDSNALALAFNEIAARNGRTLAKPSRVYIVGMSMGGHIAAAAVEAETLATARNKMRYDAALPGCGVVADVQAFDYFAAYQTAAQQLAGLPATSWPANNWPQISGHVRMALFGSPKSFSTPTPQGQLFKSLVMNLSGGARPMFEEGFANETWHGVLWETLGADGKLDGILTGNVADTRELRYRFDASEDVQNAFNASIARVTPVKDANRKRSDGLRWVPAINGEFSVPVLTLHTLGEIYVPFSLEQIYYKRAKAKGSDKHLVQRAIRDVGHCSFTDAEMTRALTDLDRWVEQGVKPAGDDVITPAVVADPAYGCAFTDNKLTAEDSPRIKAARAPGKLPACPGPQSATVSAPATPATR